MSDGFPIPDAALSNHIAILGKTGSGKSSTEKLIVEHVVDAGFRVCVLDAIKSDWWGITSSADGRAEGFPFRILGGPHGHVPLHASAGAVIGRLVGAGKLPLSIIDMADFEPGGLQRFFCDFAPALMRSMRGVVYLVIEEAHEFAPKERAGIGAENLAIHWAKKLATAGRSKGLRLIVATQRVQSLHNAVLGSCETVIAHRLTTPADQEPVIKWLKANVDKTTTDNVAGSISSLPTGSGWLCSGEAQIFERVAFPKFRTYDNAATPTGDDDEITVKTATVDQAELSALIGNAVEEAKANDPKLLKAEIIRLKLDLGKATDIRNRHVEPPIDIEPMRAAAYLEGVAEGRRDILNQIAPHVQALVDMKGLGDVIDVAPVRPLPPVPPVHSGPGIMKVVEAAKRSAAPFNGSVSKPQQRVLDALAWLEAAGLTPASREQIGWLSDYSPSSGGFGNLLSQLRTAALIEYPGGGSVALTDEGRTAAAPQNIPPTTADLHAAIERRLGRPEWRVLSTVIRHHPNPITRDDLAGETEYSASSGGFGNLLSRLRTFGFIDYPSRGVIAAQPVLFLNGPTS